MAKTTEIAPGFSAAAALAMGRAMQAAGLTQDDPELAELGAQMEQRALEALAQARPDQPTPPDPSCPPPD